MGLWLRDRHRLCITQLRERLPVEPGIAVCVVAFESRDVGLLRESLPVSKLTRAPWPLSDRL
jgi:hypothetical protein